MKFFLAYLLLTAAHCQLSFGFDLVAYKNQYQAQVGVPYKNAITVAATNIIEYLAQTPVPTTAEGGRQISANLNQQVQTVSGDLGSASTSSDALRQQLDREVESLTAQVSGVQQQLTANQQQLQQTNAQIQETNAQVAAAQGQVNTAQVSVQNAENALRNEENRVKDAEHCTPIGGWIGKHLCKIVNHDGIKRAESARDQTRADLAASQQRLAQYQAQLGQLNQKAAALQQTLAGIVANKNQLDAQLAQLNQARNNVNDVDTKLKAVIVHITTLFGKSQVLVDVVKNLIDMETVIKPLTAIADQIISFTPNAVDVAVLTALKQKIATNLPLVQQKLAQYALIPPK